VSVDFCDIFEGDFGLGGLQVFDLQDAILEYEFTK